LAIGQTSRAEGASVKERPFRTARGEQKHQFLSEKGMRGAVSERTKIQRLKPEFHWTLNGTSKLAP
jgi:hypothetical protein